MYTDPDSDDSGSDVDFAPKTSRKPRKSVKVNDDDDFEFDEFEDAALGE
jgi:hypothetical protein